jgi:hypothetical protein
MICIFGYDVSVYQLICKQLNTPAYIPLLKYAVLITSAYPDMSTECVSEILLHIYHAKWR